PANDTQFDNAAVELGVKFRSDVPGVVRGVRFYKGTRNTGTHIANLWSSSGTLLATAQFTNETASGWQEATFAAPVGINANTTYIASYHTDVGFYSSDNNFYASNGIDSPPLHAPSDAAAGGQNVYRYGSTGFPSFSFSATNYWVDVVFDDSV